MKPFSCLLLVLSLWAFVGSVHAQSAEPTVNAGSPDVNSLKVAIGKSVVINSPETLKRVSVTDPAVASAMIVSPNQVLIHGQAPGSVTLLLWDEQERWRSYNLQVAVDLDTLRAGMKEAFPGETINVDQSGASVLLNGRASTKTVADRAFAFAQTQTKNVVNMLQTSTGREVVMLQVRFAEVDRAAIQQLGINVFSTGAGNTIGLVTTGQFGGGTATNSGAVPAGINRGTDPRTPSLTAGGNGNSLQGTPSVFGLTDLLNLFFFRADINLGATIRALQQKNLLQILAEPNVMAINGTEASFLAGGEFPFPVVQNGGGFNAVTVEFKEFGVRLKFRPDIQADGRIRLRVAPEVSALDFANALTISGFLIPALSTRRADSEVELNDGESFAIAGLLDNRLANVSSKIPGLGSLPIIGRFFQSTSTNRNHTELLVMITPRIVRALPAGQTVPIPDMPKDFLNPNQFDDKRSSTSPSPSTLPTTSPVTSTSPVASTSPETPTAPSPSTSPVSTSTPPSPTTSPAPRSAPAPAGSAGPAGLFQEN